MPRRVQFISGPTALSSDEREAVDDRVPRFAQQARGRLLPPRAFTPSVSQLCTEYPGFAAPAPQFSAQQQTDDGVLTTAPVAATEEPHLTRFTDFLEEQVATESSMLLDIAAEFVSRAQEVAEHRQTLRRLRAKQAVQALVAQLAAKEPVAAASMELPPAEDVPRVRLKLACTAVIASSPGTPLVSDDDDTDSMGWLRSASSMKWISCDRCGKWRDCSRGTKEIGAPGAFFCEWNNDEEYNSCDREQEHPDSMIDMMLGHSVGYAGEVEASAEEAAEAKPPEPKPKKRKRAPKKAASPKAPVAVEEDHAQEEGEKGDDEKFEVVGLRLRGAYRPALRFYTATGMSKAPVPTRDDFLMRFAEAKAAAAKAAGDKEAERQWREAATPVALHDPEEVRLRLLQVA